MFHPSIEATFQAATRDGLFPDTATQDWRDAFREFQDHYDVDEWGIKPDEFLEYYRQLHTKHRCTACGTRGFPYHIQGDTLCISCATPTPERPAHND